MRSGSCQRHGFRENEYGLQWYPSKDALIASDPGPVLVSSSYTTGTSGGNIKPVMKFASFDNHWSYWETIHRFEVKSQMQSIHEVIPATTSRSLYFDLDGAVDYRENHDEIINWLCQYVRCFFSGDHFGWAVGDPQPVVLLSENPLKYSCHVVFPQIQFSNYAEQEAYMKVLLPGLSMLEVEVAGGTRLPILERVVDCVPYTKFQNFRGPYACKLKDGELRPETQLRPEGFFERDQLSCFAGHVDTERALTLAPVSHLLECNPELRNACEQHANRISVSGDGSHGCSLQDIALYATSFQQFGGGVLDLAGRPELDVYEEALKWLHPDRATQWWSWFRICGVTYTMLERHGRDPRARARIWQLHHAWSSQFLPYDEQENVDMIEKCQGKRVSGLPLLIRLVRYDNPEIKVRTTPWRLHMPSRREVASPQASMTSLQDD